MGGGGVNPQTHPLLGEAVLQEEDGARSNQAKVPKVVTGVEDSWVARECLQAKFDCGVHHLVQHVNVKSPME